MGLFGSKTDYKKMSEEMCEVNQAIKEEKKQSELYFSVGSSPIYEDGATIVLRGAGSTQTIDLGKANVKMLINLLNEVIGENKPQPFVSTSNSGFGGGPSPLINKDCWCSMCRPVTMNDMRMIVCPDCGNKRCPKAKDHRNECTKSNEPGQLGSAFFNDVLDTQLLDEVRRRGFEIRDGKINTRAICPACGIDRSKERCMCDPVMCPMRGNAQ